MGKECTGKCDEHSGHRTELVNNKERHQGHDNNINEIRTSLKTKVPRWVFMILVVTVLGNIGFQMRVLNVVTSIDKNVAVLTERLENHTDSAPPGQSKKAVLTDNKGRKSCLILAKNIWP